MYRSILPSEGFYCVAFPIEEGKQGPMAQRFFTTIEDALTCARAGAEQGRTAFIAQSSFVVAGNRRGDNVCKVRSFWVDIDCGPEKFAKEPHKSYPTQSDGAKALKEFCDTVGLPLPTVVNSGNGLYGHWKLSQDITPEQWKGTAEVFKKLTHALGFKADDSRTSDLASVLRPVGAYNFKHGFTEDTRKPVVLVYDQPSPIEFLDFASLISWAAKKHKVERTTLLPPKKDDINAEFLIDMQGPPCFATLVAEHCTQIRTIRDTKGDVSEPLWYAGIGLLRHCEEGEALIQEWSSGHLDYDPEATASKIAQHKLPPTTCSHFGSINPAGCMGCRHNGKIKTPIVLGRELTTVDVSTIDPSRCPIPSGFELTADGIFWSEDNSRVYPYDLYPINIALDTSLGYEVITIRHKTPQDGWKEFPIRGAILHDAKLLFMTLHDNHVQVSGATEKKLMNIYLDSYIAKLRDRNRVSTLHSQMGWCEGETGELSFILGCHVHRRNEEPERIGLARNVPEAAKAFMAIGDIHSWINHTQVYAQKGMEGHAFAFLAGAFGAPLMKFTGYEGAMISCLGESGIGKTLVARVLQSVYGHPGKLMMLRDDTKNSLVARLGVYGSLPLTVDEVSNIDPMELSDLVYRVTQGRDKARLTKNAVERACNNTWNTLAVVSSNHSLIDKLGSCKVDAGAEVNRVFEYELYPNAALSRENATAIYRVTSENYGLVGPRYIQYLVDNQDKHRANLDKIIASIDEKTSARPEERFWSAVAGVAIYGGLVAKSLGLIKFDVAPLLEWVVGTVQNMRVNKRDQVSDSVSILAQFLDRWAGNALIVANNKNNTSSTWRVPNGAVVYRADMDTMKCYISRTVLKHDLTKQFGSYSKLKYDLQHLTPKPALLATDIKRVLTKGVQGYVGAQQPVWEIDLTCPQLGMVAAQLVQIGVERMGVEKKETSA